VLDGDEESIYGYSQHNGVSRILRVASELGEAIEGKSDCMLYTSVRH
jgi:hypothetical protein